MVLFDEDEEDGVLTKVQARPRSPAPEVKSSSSRALPGGKSATSASWQKPVIYKVSSEPILRRKEHPEEAEAKARRAEFRTGLDDIFHDLDVAATHRRKAERDAEFAAKAEMAARRNYQRSIDATRNHDRLPWCPWEPMAYFSEPAPERGGSKSCGKDGEVNVARKVVDGKEGGWKDTDATRRDFGTKAKEHMGPSERLYHRRLEDRLQAIDMEERAALALQKDGRHQRQRARTASGDYSALHGDQPWTTQITSKPYFSIPETSKKGADSDPALKHYIEQPERTTSYAKDIVVGDAERTSHWKPRMGQAGNSSRQAEARALLCPPCMRDSKTRWKERI